jgi:ribonuclease R
MLKRLLKDMADEGLIDSSPGRAFHKAGGVPKVTVLRVVEVDDSGSLGGARAMARRDAAAAAAGDRARAARRARHRRPHARADRGEGAGLVAHPMKKLERSAELVLGVVRRRASASGCRRSTRRSGASSRSPT